jgi:hypothetical protein
LVPNSTETGTFAEPKKKFIEQIQRKVKMQPLIVDDTIIDFSEFEPFEVAFNSLPNAPLVSDTSDISASTNASDSYLPLLIEKCNIFIGNTNSAFTIEQLVREILKITQQTATNIENDLYNLIG